MTGISSLKLIRTFLLFSVRYNEIFQKCELQDLDCE